MGRDIKSPEDRFRGVTSIFPRKLFSRKAKNSVAVERVSLTYSFVDKESNVIVILDEGQKSAFFVSGFKLRNIAPFDQQTALSSRKLTANDHGVREEMLAAFINSLLSSGIACTLLMTFLPSNSGSDMSISVTFLVHDEGKLADAKSIASKLLEKKEIVRSALNTCMLGCSFEELSWKSVQSPLGIFFR